MTIENATQHTINIAAPLTAPLSHQVVKTAATLHVEAAGRYAELMRVAFSPHLAGQQRVVLFTAPAPGAGVSFVSSAVARELSTLVSGSILVIEAALLDLLRSEEIQSIKALLLNSPKQANVSRVSTEMVRRRTGPYPDPARRSFTDLLHLLRMEFDHIIIDAPALSRCDLAMRYAADVDAVVLIVEANKTPAGAIASACRRLHTVNATLAGLVCNKRTYPIPAWLYKWIY